MTWEEVNEAVREKRVMLFPVATLEQHGRHLLIDTNVVAVERMCNEAARQAPELLVVAPTITYGFNQHNMDFPGTVNINTQNLIGYVYDVCRSFAYHGFDRLILVNGHGSNAPFLQIVARLTNNKTNSLYAFVNYWSLARGAVAKV